MSNYRLLPAVALFAVGALGVSHSQAASHPCATHADPEVRLACYDQAFGAPDTREQSAALTVKAKQEFGLAGTEQRQRKTAVAEPDVDQIEARIDAISSSSGGERVLTLDNGQVWRIVDRTIRGQLKVGDQVQVRKGALSAHRLVTPAGVGLRVKRVR